jgi:hypothetical protein
VVVGSQLLERRMRLDARFVPSQGIGVVAAQVKKTRFTFYTEAQRISSPAL